MPTLALGQSGQPSHILVTDNFNDCAKLGGKITAVVIIPPWSPAARAFFADLDANKLQPELDLHYCSGNTESTGFGIIERDATQACLKPAMANAAEKALAGTPHAGLALRDELAAAQANFIEAAYPLIARAKPQGRIPVIGISRRAHPYHRCDQVLTPSGAIAGANFPSTYYLLGQDSIDTTELRKEDGNGYYSGSIAVYNNPALAKDLWRVPTGAFAVIAPTQYVGFNTELEPGKNAKRDLSLALS